MLTKQEFTINQNEEKKSLIQIIFERKEEYASGIECWNEDKITIKKGKQTIQFDNEEAYELMNICRNTKFIFDEKNNDGYVEDKKHQNITPF